MNSSLITPDSPYRIGTSGKYKLLIIKTEKYFDSFGYELKDAEGKEYKAIGKTLYLEGQLLRCLVNFKVDKAKLVVESVAICSKQDLATPVPVEKKPKAEPQPKSSPAQETIPSPKKKAKTKTKCKSKTNEDDSKTKLGDPRQKLVSGVYVLRVTRFQKNATDFSYWLKDAKDVEYPFQSKRYLKVGCDYFFKVNITMSSSGALKIDIIKTVNPNAKRKSGNGGKTHKYALGYSHQDWEPTIYKGGGQIIYTRM